MPASRPGLRTPIRMKPTQLTLCIVSGGISNDNFLFSIPPARPSSLPSFFLSLALFFQLRTKTLGAFARPVPPGWGVRLWDRIITLPHLLPRPLGRWPTGKRTSQLNPLSRFLREAGENTMATTWRESLMARQHHVSLLLSLAVYCIRLHGSPSR